MKKYKALCVLGLDIEFNNALGCLNAVPHSTIERDIRDEIKALFKSKRKIKIKAVFVKVKEG